MTDKYAEVRQWIRQRRLEWKRTIRDPHTTPAQKRAAQAMLDSTGRCLDA